MIRHVVVFRWVPGVTSTQAEQAADALRALLGAIPSLREITVGTDLGLRDNSWDIAVVALFDDADGYRAYQEHPAHLKVAQGVMGPMIAERASVQMEA